MYVVDAAVATDTPSGVLVVLTQGVLAPAQDPRSAAAAGAAKTPAASSNGTRIQRCGGRIGPPWTCGFRRDRRSATDPSRACDGLSTARNRSNARADATSSPDAPSGPHRRRD